MHSCKKVCQFRSQIDNVDTLTDINHSMKCFNDNRIKRENNIPIGQKSKYMKHRRGSFVHGRRSLNVWPIVISTPVNVMCEPNGVMMTLNST